MLYVLGRWLHSAWDAGYWALVVVLPFAIVGAAYLLSSEQDRKMFREDLSRLLNRLRLR